MRKKLEQLKADFRKRERTYNEAANQARKNSGLCNTALLDSNRYEGIATASRWAAEDVEKILEKKKRK